MALIGGKLLLLLVAAFVGVALVPHAEATITVTSNFDSYTLVLNRLTSMNDRLTVLRAVWGEIRAEGADDLHRVKSFYDHLLQYTYNAVNAEAEEAAELMDEARNVLVIKNGRLLAETLNNNASQNINDVILFRSNLLSNYPVELLYAIFERAIDAEYGHIAPHILHAALDAIELKSVKTLNEFKVRVHWNLYLYYKFLRMGDVNDAYIYTAALAIRNLRYNNFYSNLNTETKRRVEAVFQTLPSSLYTLFTSATVCLENVNIYNHYLYLPESNTANVYLYVPAVIRSRFDAAADRTRWLNSFANTALANQTDMTLKAQSNSWILYRQQTNTTMIVQRTDNLVALRNWKPLMRNNNILFEQSGFYMCATSVFNGELRGFGVVSTKDISLDDTSCQWTISDCSQI